MEREEPDAVTGWVLMMLLFGLPLLGVAGIISAVTGYEFMDAFARMMMVVGCIGVVVVIGMFLYAAIYWMATGRNWEG